MTNNSIDTPLITLGGTFTMTGGAFNFTGTLTGDTTVTFPTSGTLATISQLPTGAALTKVNDTNVTLTLGGSPSIALLNAASLTLGWTGQLGLTRGGTNASLTASAGAVIYSTASAFALSAAGSSGQLFQSSGTTAPGWTTATYPATAGSSGNVLTSNGTNWISSAPATSGTVTSVATNNGLTGGTITSTGTLGLAAIADHTLLANISGGALFPSSTTLTALIDNAIGSTQGNILYRNATSWVVLAPGTNGEFLQTQGAAANVQWASPAGSGTVSAGSINQLAWYAANGTTVSGLSTSNNGVLVTDSGGIPSISSTTPAFLTIPTPYIDSIYDVSENLQVLSITAGAGAVNYIDVVADATGVGPTIRALGADNNIELTLDGKGTKGVALAGVSDGSNAQSGYVGEIISNLVVSSSPVSSPGTGISFDITFITLPAGSWEIFANVFITPTGSAQSYLFWASTASATPNDISLTSYISGASLGQYGCPVPSLFIETASPQNIYLSVDASFASGNVNTCGYLWAVRRR